MDITPIQSGPSRPYPEQKQTHTDKAVMDAITAHCRIALPGINAAQKKEVSEQILTGDSTFLNSPLVSISHQDSLSLLLNPIEIEHLHKIATQSPIGLNHITLFTLLGLHVYLAIKFFAKRGHLVKERPQQFCRTWVLGHLSQLTDFKPGRWSTSPEDFAEKIQQISQNLETKCRSLTKKEKTKKFDSYYTNFILGTQILTKLFQSEQGRPLICRHFCYEIAELRSDTPSISGEKTAYRGFKKHLQFAFSVFQATEDIQLDRQNAPLEELKRLKERSELIYAANPKHRLSAKEVLEEGEAIEEADFQTTWLTVITETQKETITQVTKLLLSLNLVNRTVNHIKSEEIKSGLYTVSRQGVPSIKPRARNRILRTTDVLMAAEHCRFFYQFFDELAVMLENYVTQCQPDYIIISSHIMRAESLHLLFHKSAVKIARRQTGRTAHLAKNTLQHVCPRDCLGLLELSTLNKLERIWITHSHTQSLAFFQMTETFHEVLPSFQDRTNLFQLLRTLEQDIQAIIPPKGALKLHIEQQEAERDQAFPTATHHTYNLASYASFYVMIKEYVDQLYASLTTLKKTHTKKCLKFLETLSIETCRTYKNKLFELKKYHIT